MASNPPSGASRLPDILSFCRICLKVVMLLVRVMTCLKEKGESLFVHGSFSLRERQTDPQTDGQRDRWRKQTDMQVDKETDRGTDRQLGGKKRDFSNY